MNGNLALSWRITKYDSDYRNLSGSYTKKERTSYSDIGKRFGNRGVLTFKEYLKIEDAYVKAVQTFMHCLDIDRLTISCLEKNVKDTDIVTDKYSSSAMITSYQGIKNGNEFSKESIEIVVRLILREKLWCKLVSKDMFVHFGWDYYMYIGADQECHDAIQKIEKYNLFTEPYESPYL